MSTDRWQRARGERKEQEERVGVGRGFGNNVQGCSGVQGEEAKSQGSKRGDHSLVRMPGREGGPRGVPLEKARSSWLRPWTCPRRKLGVSEGKKAQELEDVPAQVQEAESGCLCRPWEGWN